MIELIRKSKRLNEHLQRRRKKSRKTLTLGWTLITLTFSSSSRLMLILCTLRNQSANMSPVLRTWIELEPKNLTLTTGLLKRNSKLSQLPKVNRGTARQNFPENNYKRLMQVLRKSTSKMCLWRVRQHDHSTSAMIWDSTSMSDWWLTSTLN